MTTAAAEKRSVNTDALETLGTKPIPENSGRDAIHLAVEPVIAGTTIFPGQDIGIENGLAGPSQNPLGIADPFMTCPVKQGERFWLVVYPRQITSLRHVWSHPAFPEDDGSVRGEVESPSKTWIENYAAGIPLAYETLMDGAAEWLRDKRRGGYGECLCFGGLLEGEYVPDEFWTHYASVTGEPVDDDEKGSFFTCSC